MTTTKTKPKTYTETLVLDAKSVKQTGIPAYPSTPQTAQKNFEGFFAEKLSEGWIYHGEITVSVSAERRIYWVFYR